MGARLNELLIVCKSFISFDNYRGVDSWYSCRTVSVEEARPLPSGVQWTIKEGYDQ